MKINDKLEKNSCDAFCHFEHHYVYFDINVHAQTGEESQRHFKLLYLNFHFISVGVCNLQCGSKVCHRLPHSETVRNLVSHLK